MCWVFLCCRLVKVVMMVLILKWTLTFLIHICFWWLDEVILLIIAFLVHLCWGHIIFHVATLFGTQKSAFSIVVFLIVPSIIWTLCLCDVIGQVITGSWDKTIKCWDPRGASGAERTQIGTYQQPERVNSLSLVGNRLVVATAGRHVNIYDLRNMSQPEQRRESSLKYQTRCVRCYPNGTG